METFHATKTRLLERLEALEREARAAWEALEAARRAVEAATPDPVIWQYRTCGKAHCRCRRGLKHGPYPYRRVREGGRWRYVYLGREYQPPEGAVPLREHRRRLEALAAERARYEACLERLEEAVRALAGEPAAPPRGRGTRR